MKTVRHSGKLAIAIVGIMVMAGCGTTESMEGKTRKDGSTTIVIGSQDYYSNEIIAEIYAQSLEKHDFTVERDFRIGQREVYLPEIEAGNIDVFPEYSGNLLQYYDKDTLARTHEEVSLSLEIALPDGVYQLNHAPATDQDSYNVTAAFAKKYNVHTLADLATVGTSIVLGGNSELEARPYGPKGLHTAYEVDVEFTPIEDSGGPLTIKALLDEDVQLVNIYSADPRILENNLVTLTDPEGLFLTSNVVPITSGMLPEKAGELINSVNAKLTSDVLVKLNSESISAQKSASQIAANWLEKG